MSISKDSQVKPDLDALAQQHREEERAESERTLLQTPRPMGVNLPAGGLLEKSKG